MVIAALDLAEQMAVPLEWFALSSGALISMDSGTENMDWVALALRRLDHLHPGRWRGERDRGRDQRGGAAVLERRSDHAPAHQGHPGHDTRQRNGLDGQAVAGLLGRRVSRGQLRHRRIRPGDGTERAGAVLGAEPEGGVQTSCSPTTTTPTSRLGKTSRRRADSSDPHDRDVRSYPHVHPSSDFTTVGDIFSDEVNKERKKPFDIRTVMRAVVDQDHAVLERWAGMADADTTVVMDAHLGGHPVEVHRNRVSADPAAGWFPADGPDQWTAGTLFPQSSKKTARAINAASGNRPLVVLANLSGFDGSPESLRKMQLEYGAEIGRAIVNFDGPIVFCVISRFHGGAFVVFSSVLNDNMEVIAVEGSFASVIGGAPAAAVVFAREVETRTSKDPRIKRWRHALAEADEARAAPPAGRAGRSARRGSLGEARRGGGRVRTDSQHREGAGSWLRPQDHSRARTPALPDRRRRAGSQPNRIRPAPR